MNILLRVISIVGVVIIYSCNNGSPISSECPKNEIAIKLMSDDKYLKINETTKITCVYSIESPPPGTEADTFVTSGYFAPFPQWWEITSGDSCWIDTTVANKNITRSISLKPLRAGNLFFFVYVKSSLDVPDSSYLANQDVIFFRVSK